MFAVVLNNNNNNNKTAVFAFEDCCIFVLVGHCLKNLVACKMQKCDLNSANLKQIIVNYKHKIPVSYLKMILVLYTEPGGSLWAT